MPLGFSESVWHSEWPIRLDMYWRHTHTHIYIYIIIYYTPRKTDPPTLSAPVERGHLGGPLDSKAQIH